MAQPGFLEGGDYGSWWQASMHHHGYVPPSPLHEADWARIEPSSTHVSPHHRRRVDVHRPAYSAFAAPPSSVGQRPAVRAASLLLSTPSPPGRGMRHHNSALPLSLPRASTAPTGRKTKSQFFDARSQSGSQRALSHRDQSPRSVHQHRSTPDSRRSMRSSLTESDGETAVTESSQEAEQDKADDAESILMGKESKPDFQWPETNDELEEEEEGGGGGERITGRDEIYEEDREEDDDVEDQTRTQTRIPYQGYESEHQRVKIHGTEQQKQPRRHHRQHHRHGSRSRGSGSGGGGSNSARGPRLEQVIYEEDAEEPTDADDDMDYGMDNATDDYHRRTRTPSRPNRHRSASRHTSTTLDHRSAVSRTSRLRRIDSIDDAVRSRASPRSSRRSMRYSESEQSAPYYGEPPASLRRAQTLPAAVSHAESTPSVASRSSVMGSVLGFSANPFAVDKPTKFYDCVDCKDDFAPSKVVKLRCGHRMCKPCLKQRFQLSLNDPRHMPPRCCTSSPIPVKHVENLLTIDFKRAWNQKFREQSVARRIYCPARKCGEWIQSEDIYLSQGRKIARCSHCRTRVCCLCNGKMHSSRECPAEEGSNRIFEMAKAEGWQNCYKCKEPVYFHEGEDRMRCRPCGAQSCMICGGKYKSCDCPVFDCESEVAHDSLVRYSQVASVVAPPSTRDYRDSKSSAMSTILPHPQNYDDSRSFARSHVSHVSRVSKYQEDEDLALRMQAMDGLGGSSETLDYGYEDYGVEEEDDHSEDARNYPNYPRHYAHDDMMIHPQRRHNYAEEYPRRAATVVTPSAPPLVAPPRLPTPPQQKMLPMSAYPLQQSPQYPTAPPAFDRSNSGGDYYVTGVNRARGVGSSSQDRRLADRFNSDRSPGGQMPMTGVPPVPPVPQPVPAMAPPMAAMPYGPISPHGPGPVPPPPMAPMMSMGMPHPPPPPPNMACRPMMPMAPPPPMPTQAVGTESPMRRRLDDSSGVRTTTTTKRRSPDRHANQGMRRNEPSDIMMDSDPSSSTPRRGGNTSGSTLREHDDQQQIEPPSSMLAGLTGPGRGMNRVQEWVTYVPTGAVPSDEIAVA